MLSKEQRAIKKKNKNLFRRIAVKPEPSYPDSEEFIRKALKNLEETVRININANDSNLRFFAEAIRDGSSGGRVEYSLLLYPEQGKKIIGFSLNGKLDYVSFLSGTASPLSFIYKGKGEKFACQIRLRNPYDKGEE